MFWFEEHRLKNTNFGSKGGLQQNGFFNNLCFAKCEKLSFFRPFFGHILADVQKHYNIGISARFLSKNKKMTILKGSSKGYYLGQVCCNIKMANLAQMITLQIFARTFVFKSAETPIFIVLVDKQC